MIKSKLLKFFFGEKNEIDLYSDPCYYYKRTFWISLILGFLIIFPFMVREYITTGSFIFLYYGDYNVQQVPFYEHCVRMVHEGNFGWDWHTDLGSNFIGSYSYYLLGSPFFWIMCLFPASFAPYLMGPIYVVKFVVAALTSFAFFKRFVKNKEYAVIGALLYSYCGFQIYNIFFNQFQEVVALFPLLLLGMEELIQNDRKGLFAVSVALNCMCNYFMFAGQAVFCIIYFLARCFSRSFGISFKKFLLLAFEAILGVLLGAVLFLPACLGILGNYRLSYRFAEVKDMLLYLKNGDLYVDRYGHILQSLFFPPDIPSRVNFFGGLNYEKYGHTARWSSNAAWIPAFGLAGVFAYMRTHKKSVFGWLVLVLIFMALVPILNSTFFLFNSNYYARWIYMMVMVGIVCTIIALDDVNTKWNFGFGINTFCIVVISAYAGLRWFESIEQPGTIYSLGQEPFAARLWISVSISVGCMVALWLIIRKFRGTEYLPKIILCTVCVTIVVYGVIHVFCGKEHSTSTELIVDTAVSGDINIDDDEFYRIDFYRTSDSGIECKKYYRYEGSIGEIAGNTFKIFCKNASKFKEDESYTLEYDGEKYDAYVIEIDTKSSEKTVKVSAVLPDKIKEGDSVNLLTNPVSTTTKYTNVYDNLGISWEENSVECFHSVVPSSIMDFYEKVGVTRNVGSRAVYDKYGLLGFLSVKYSLIRETSSKHLSDENDSGGSSEVYYGANGLSFSYYDTQNQYKIYENEYYVSPGFYYTEFMTETEFEKISKGLRHIFLLKYMVVPDDEAEYYSRFMTEVKYKDASIKNYTTYLASVEERRECTADTFEYGSYSIKAEIDLENDNLVLFTVPYENGWSCKVNGKEVEVKKVTYGFMAVECSGSEDGHYTIEFSYTTPGLIPGALISLAALVVLLLYIYISGKKGKKPNYRFFKEDYVEE